jgi:hypothetical protein
MKKTDPGSGINIPNPKQASMEENGAVASNTYLSSGTEASVYYEP